MLAATAAMLAATAAMLATATATTDTTALTLRSVGAVTLSTTTNVSFPSTLPKSMILGIVNDAPWSYTLDPAHTSVTKGSFAIQPRSTLPHSRTKTTDPAVASYAFEVTPDSDGNIDARLLFVGEGGGEGFANRNFSAQLVSGGSEFGVFYSMSHVTLLTMAPPIVLGTDTDYKSVQRLTLEARRPLSSACRKAATALCGPAGQACRQCVQSVANRDALEDGGCDWRQRVPDLVDVTCDPRPLLPGCVAAAAKACPQPADVADWETCHACLGEKIRSGALADACPVNATSMLKLTYADCVGA